MLKDMRLPNKKKKTRPKKWLRKNPLRFRVLDFEAHFISSFHTFTKIENSVEEKLSNFKVLGYTLGDAIDHDFGFATRIYD